MRRLIKSLGSWSHVRRVGRPNHADSAVACRGSIQKPLGLILAVAFNLGKMPLSCLQMAKLAVGFANFELVGIGLAEEEG